MASFSLLIHPPLILERDSPNEDLSILATAVSKTLLAQSYLKLLNRTSRVSEFLAASLNLVVYFPKELAIHLSVLLKPFTESSAIALLSSSVFQSNSNCSGPSSAALIIVSSSEYKRNCLFKNGDNDNKPPNAPPKTPPKAVAIAVFP